MEKKRTFISPYVYAGLIKIPDLSTSLTLKQISDGVCEYFKITLHALRGESKDRLFVKPRHIFIGIALEFSTKNANLIAKHIHRTTATIYNGFKRFEEDIKQDNEYFEDYQNIKLKLLFNASNIEGE
jgi:chromosomal replication initiation ATPase DnaA